MGPVIACPLPPPPGDRVPPERAGALLRRQGAQPRIEPEELILWNNALVSALGLRSYEEVRSEPERWGRLVENAVGAHLVNHLQGLTGEVTYWRHRHHEVDYVVQRGRSTWAIEVKSGRPGRLAGLAEFLRLRPSARPLIVGSGGIPLEEFFTRDPRELFV